MPPAEFQLSVTVGPNSGTTYPLNAPITIIGRDASCDFVISDVVISRQHAKLTLQGGRCLIEDMGSSNGTFINGNRLGSSPVPLAPGDQIQLGNAATLVLESLVSPEAPTMLGLGNLARGAATIFDAEGIDLSGVAPELMVTVAGNPGRDRIPG